MMFYLTSTPPGASPVEGSLLRDAPEPVNPIVFDTDAIHQAALHTNGALRTRRICLETSVFFLWISLPQPMFHPGCSGSPHMHYPCPSRGVERMPTDPTRQMSRCETHRSWRGPETNSMLRIVGRDVEEAAGPLQVCAGQDGGCEAAVHAMRRIFHHPDTEGVLLVDATNAFNTINRQAVLHNISIICPSIAQILINTYRTPVRMVIVGSGELASTEGTTQGDPLAMATL